MGYKATFKRYEYKYILSAEQKIKVLEAMKPYMKIDEYGRATIRNIYFDTDNFRLIRRSMEKPMYKEKLRIRSYKSAGPNDMAFLEIKKKYDSVVYKRRIKLPAGKALNAFDDGVSLDIDSQIGNEIEYFRGFYENLKPKMYISYEREAYFYQDDPQSYQNDSSNKNYVFRACDFRVTFDENILYRTDNLTLEGEAYGTSILKDGDCLMEIKCAGAMPMWMCEVLSENKIYKKSFSKYGMAYQSHVKSESGESIDIVRSNGSVNNQAGSVSYTNNRNASSDGSIRYENINKGNNKNNDDNKDKVRRLKYA